MATIKFDSGESRGVFMIKTKPNNDNTLYAMECSFTGHVFELLFAYKENGIYHNIPVVGLNEDLELSIYGCYNEEWEWEDTTRFKYTSKYAYNRLLEIGEDFYYDDLKFFENRDEIEYKTSFSVILEYQIVDGKKQMTVMNQDISDYKKTLIESLA